MPCFLKTIGELFSRAWDGKAMLRLVGVALSSFSTGPGQLELLDPGRREKLERLARTADRLRDKFGFSKLQLGGFARKARIRRDESPSNERMARALAERVCRILRGAGYQAYFVGGCVRDILLDREPADYDVATDATPDRVQQLFPHSLAVGAQFGVIVVTEDSRLRAIPCRWKWPRFARISAIRTAGIRIASSTRKRPRKMCGAATSRSTRCCSIPKPTKCSTSSAGAKISRAGIIRAIGNAEERFREDKLRMVRAVRFAARFRLRDRSGYVCRHREAGAGNPPSLRRADSRRTHQAAHRGRGAPRLRVARRNPALARTAARNRADEGRRAAAAISSRRRRLDSHAPDDREAAEPDCSPTLAWGVLLHDVGKPPTFKPPSGPGGRIRFDEHVEVGTRMAEEICRRLRFSNEDTAQIAALVANHMRFKDVLQMKPATLKRFVRLDRFEEHMELHRLDCLRVATGTSTTTSSCAGSSPRPLRSRYARRG